MKSSVCLLALAAAAEAAYLDRRQATTTVESSSTPVPDYFQTSPELFPGMMSCLPMSYSYQPLGDGHGESLVA